MQQLEIDAPLRALARNTDPVTSQLAAARIKAGSISAKVLESLKVYGPANTDELAARLGLKLVTVSPRLRPLAERGLVREGPIVDRKIRWEYVHERS